jgi:hypothetical protein
MTGNVPGLNKETYDGIISQVGDKMRASKGFIFHASVPSGDHWKIVEIWESEADGQAWFEGTVRPNLPAEIKPDRSYEAIHNIVKP